MDQEFDNLRNFCCFCGDECNPSSQSCGPCMRKNYNGYNFTSCNVTIDKNKVTQQTPEDVNFIDEYQTKFTNVEHYNEQEDFVQIKKHKPSKD